MKNHRLDLQTANHAEISRLAFISWEKDGCPMGHDLEYWLQAESQMMATWHLLLREYKQKFATAGRPGKNGIVVMVKRASRKNAAR